MIQDSAKDSDVLFAINFLIKGTRGRRLKPYLLLSNKNLGLN